MCVLLLGYFMASDIKHFCILQPSCPPPPPPTPTHTQAHCQMFKCFWQQSIYLSDMKASAHMAPMPSPSYLPSLPRTFNIFLEMFHIVLHFCCVVGAWRYHSCSNWRLKFVAVVLGFCLVQSQRHLYFFLFFFLPPPPSTPLLIFILFYFFITNDRHQSFIL